jgi:hypothetical protein
MKFAAAVIAGTVLETALRQLCLDRMNADLAKAGVYNSLMQKRITALAAIRNRAAHGKPTNSQGMMSRRCRPAAQLHEAEALQAGRQVAL